jgi:formylglycine-generating enzyme required for sulfatase activity
VTIDWVFVDEPGNAPDNSGACYGGNCGSVGHPYYISKYEVTNAQYVEFLNAKATSDPLELYNTSMGSDATFGGIDRSGVSGSFTYEVKPGFAAKPVVYVSFYDAVRFANWLQNGQANGDTETGTYTLLGGTTIPSNGATVQRNPGPTIALPRENEWYKAAYYAGGGVYFDFPNGADAEPACVAPSADTGNAANCFPYANPPGTLTDVGAYALSVSPSGTHDQGGNVWEWLERITTPGSRELRGGAWSADPHGTGAASLGFGDGPDNAVNNRGFRLVNSIPEPSIALLLGTGLLGIAARRKRHH